jgi:hypothetical protein
MPILDNSILVNLYFLHNLFCEVLGLCQHCHFMTNASLMLTSEFVDFEVLSHKLIYVVLLVILQNIRVNS